jgi:hypothetical protein
MSNIQSIKSIADLKVQQQKTRERLQHYELDFKKKIQQLPGELAVASANNFIPRFLRGKVTDTALSGGKFLIDKFFVEPGQTNATPTRLPLRKSGVIPFVQTVFRMFKNRK